MKRRSVLFVLFIFALTTTAFLFGSCDMGQDDVIDLSGDNIEIVFSKTQFEYNGLPQYPGFQIVDGYDIIEEYQYGEHNDDIIVTYDANIYVGTATVTVTAVNGGKYTGRVIGQFQIVQQTKKVKAGDFQTLKKYLDGGGYANVLLTADVTVPEGQSLTVEKDVVVDAFGYALVNNGNLENKGEIVFNEYGTGNLLENNGTFTNKGKILLYVSTENSEALANEGKLLNTGEIYLNGKDGNRLVARNHGNFDNSGIITFNRYVDFYNYGTFANGGDVKNYSENKFYTNSDVIGNAIKYISRRYPLTEFEIYLSDDTCKYDGTAHKPAIHFKKDGYNVDYGDYEAVYENNVDVGTATITVYPTDDSDAFYGDPIVLHFEIVQ